MNPYLISIVLLLFSCNSGVKKIQETEMKFPLGSYVVIGDKLLEFRPPSTFGEYENNIASENTAITMVGSQTYSTNITIITVKILNNTIAQSEGSRESNPDDVIRTTPYTTKFGASKLHYSKVQFMPGAINHEFHTQISTPNASVSIVCITYSNDLDKIEKMLLESFQTIREVEQ